MTGNSMTGGSAPAAMKHGEPPSSLEEVMADQWLKIGFLVLEHEYEGRTPVATWVKCRHCKAHVHALGAIKHRDRCIVLNPDSKELNHA